MRLVKEQILRKRYLDRLLSARDRPDSVKVITGIRRCGKTTLMKQFMDLLISGGVDREDIIYINFESLEYDFIKDYSDLHGYIKSRLSERRTYIFLDEVQTVKGWEKAVNSLRVDSDTDIYVTGSNAYLLSSELSTLLTGRTIPINVLPLSFKEFLEMNPCDGSRSELEGRYDDYVRIGSLPIVSTRDDPDNVKEMLTGILNTIINRDIAPRNEIREFTVLNNLTRYILDNCGNLTNPSSLAKELGISNPKLIDSYLTLLEQAYIVYKAERFDLKGKRILKTNAKYYCTDVGMRSAAVGYGVNDRGHVLENVVFLELVRRGYDVKVGAYNGKEIGFTARKGGDVKYYQVAWTLNHDSSDREMGTFKDIRDNYPKTIITTGRTVFDNDGGIRITNNIDFLTEEW